MISIMQSLKIRIRNRMYLFPKVSIIIPFYNSEKYIEKCLISIVYGTKIPCEIICVNDGSMDGSVQIVKKLKHKYWNISLINLPENRGLYYARLQGVKKARAEYIGFVDSDDYIENGYFDFLYYGIKKTDSDISVGVVVNQSQSGELYIQSRCKKFPYITKLTKADAHSTVYDRYWEQEGRCYDWHIVWNKLYRRTLWKSVLSILEGQKRHLVMLEDFIFSSVVLLNVNNYVVVEQAKYYYVEHEKASIKITQCEKTKKNILDMKYAFDFVEAYLSNNRDICKYRENFSSWKQRYGRYWKNNIINSDMQKEEKRECLYELKKNIGYLIEDLSATDNYYYEIAEFLQ